MDAFLQRCEETGLKLKLAKVELRKKEVPLIEHVATGEGLCADSAKVQVIREMPPPTDVAAVRCLLDLTQYLSKFLSYVSNLMKPL